MADIPPAPTAAPRKKNELTPADYDPDLAAAKLASDMMERYGTPGIVSKQFVIWHGLLRGLNHSESNPTYYDCSRILSVFDSVFHNSVNIDGANFEKSWQYLFKPKVVIQGIAGQQVFDQTQEDKAGIIDRIRSWFGGGEKNNGAE